MNKTKKLLTAKQNKKDEFYTQLKDIENELKYYQKYFQNKVVYCPCDDPLQSNFYKYFVKNFKQLKLKKIISSCYQSNSQGYYFEYTGKEIIYPKREDVIYFDGDGDFRSQETVKLFEEADIIVTNPPFSLFRYFFETINKFNKSFLIIGNINSVTYKVCYDLIGKDKVWLGENIGRGISGFILPDYYELFGTEFKIDENNQKIISPNNCLWLTNLENPRRQKNLPLTKSYQNNELDYPYFDNLKAINIDKTVNIPKDFDGIMGVPLTFLHKHNPNQFEIIGFRKGNDGKDLKVNGTTKYFRILIKNKNIKQ